MKTQTIKTNVRSVVFSEAKEAVLNERNVAPLQSGSSASRVRFTDFWVCNACSFDDDTDDFTSADSCDAVTANAEDNAVYP